MCTTFDHNALAGLPPVSIPFKRESTCAPPRKALVQAGMIVSIPFKRESTCALELIRRNSALSAVMAIEVSIPFKRESTCALTLFNFSTLLTKLSNGFNSLQTGKHMCTSAERWSNATWTPTVASLPGFNSLQTGKHMCTFKRDQVAF